jgi:hypothetical protein
MCHHVPYENFPGSIVDKCGQPILVPAYVEDREFADGIGMRIGFPHIYDTRPPGSLGDPIPVVKRRLGIPVRIGKIAERFTADDPHAPMLSKRDQAVKP